MDGPSNPQHLDYAARPPLRHRIWRRVGWGILLLLIGFVFIRIGPVVWRNVGILIAQNKCLAYHLPPDQIVFSSNQRVTAPEWLDFYSRISPPGATSQPTLFLHERISPGGNRRLVYLGGGRGLSAGLFVPSARVFIPGTAASAPREALNSRRSGMTLNAGSEVFAGQADPDDSSHFTIRFRDDGMETILDGWLLDDDTVLIEPRPTQPLPSTLPGSN